MGRLFTTTDDQRGCGDAACSSAMSSAARIRRRSNVIGSTLKLGDHAFEIIGVTPASFFGMEVGRSFDLALPICAVALCARQITTFSRYDVVGDGDWPTEAGWSLAQANAHTQTISPGLFEAALPPNYPASQRERLLGSELIAVPAGSAYPSCEKITNSRYCCYWRLRVWWLLIACATWRTFC